MKFSYFVFFIAICWNQWSIAELKLVNLDTLADSEEPYSRRIYSYDFDVSKDGTIHYVYSQPVFGEERAQIVYTSKRIGEKWPAKSERIILENHGSRPSGSTFLIYDDLSDTVHISYIVSREFVDHENNKHSEGLVYQKITGGSVGSKINVSPGGYHTAMQLNEKNQAIFLREYDIFLDSSGKLLTAPYPQALRMLIPTSSSSWTDREHILNLPEEEDYRLANFVYDKSNGRYHILYGNKDAKYLRETYPSTSPSAGSTKTPVYFPPGVGHQLIYAYSDDLETWQTSVVDGTGNLSENEFWTDIGFDLQGKPFVANYRYKTDSRGIHKGSTGNFSRFLEGQWVSRTISGVSQGATEHVAGMGAKIIMDKQGYFHGIWDNSPESPIDSESPNGTTMYRFSPDGINWQTRQMILPFSAEGKCLAKIYNDTLLVSLLTDYKDARLVFAEFKLPQVEQPIFEVSTDKMFYGANEPIKFHARMQKGEANSSDLYFVVMGPYDKTLDGEYIPTPATSSYYLDSNFFWQEISNVFDARPIRQNFGMLDFSGFFSDGIAKSKKKQEPFIYPARYLLYSAAMKADSSLMDLETISPLHIDEIHICNEEDCAEFLQ